jgi:choline-sulfatase
MAHLSRRIFLQSAAGMAGYCARGGESPAPSGRPPNVVLLMSDQHRRDAMGAAGSRVAQTPNLDRLARQGVRFTSAYTANPVCTPSRASMLTGLFSHHNQTYNNSTPWPRRYPTLAHYLSRAGYQTALIGKMHFVDGQTHGFDYHLDFNDWFQELGPKTRLYANELEFPNSGAGLPQIDDLWRDTGDPWKNDREPDGRLGPVAVGRVSRIPEQDQFETFVARESVRFLRQHGREAPFFLVASFLKPHDPFMPIQRFADRFRPEDMVLPPTFGKVNLSTAPDEVRRAILRNRATPELSDPEQARRRMAFYFASLAQMDDCLGKVLAALDELDYSRDTIVIYTSDHGEMLGDHGLWQKFQFYEPSCGIPLLVRAPGIAPPASICDMPVSNVQYVNTVCELCGVPQPDGLDAASFARQIRNPADTAPTTVYSEFALHSRGAKYMIRQGSLKYTLRTHDREELFDLASDPHEMRNLALEPDGKEPAAKMKQKLFAWYTPTEMSLS